MITYYNHNDLTKPLVKHLGLIRQGIDGNFKMFQKLSLICSGPSTLKVVNVWVTGVTEP